MDHIYILQRALSRRATRKVREWWTRYLRNEIKFRGVNLVDIRKELHRWIHTQEIHTMRDDKRLELALALFKEEFAEDKLAGVLFLQDFLWDRFTWQELLPRFERLFDEGSIHDWNVCDWFCVRVLSSMIERHGTPCARAAADWSGANNLWRARASVVSFVPTAKHDIHTPLILSACRRLIRREERFAKAAVGWVLREVSHVQGGKVLKFIETNTPYFSRESLDNASKYLPEKVRKAVRGKFQLFVPS